MSLEKFWSKVQKTKDCWLWIAAVNNGGYGAFAYEGRRVMAHRLSYEIEYGPFDKKLFVLHRCDNPRCVRPDHLWLGTQFDNMRDCASKGRNKNAFRWTKENNPFTGKTRSDREKEIVRQRRQRPYSFIGPAGERITGVNLTAFCLIHGLNQGAMWSVMKGKKLHHKGYRRSPDP